MIVRSMEKLKTEHGIPYRMQCSVHNTSYSTAMRWRSRVNEDRAAVMVPGPKKIAPLDLIGLQEQIAMLKHGQKRTAGIGDLYDLFAMQISRRDLQALVADARAEEHREHRTSEYRIRWNCPGLVWSMDDTEDYYDVGKMIIHNARDLGARYMFDPLAGQEHPCGEEVAGNLARLFAEHGPPLFIKRDNGGNLNHHVVDDLFSEYMAIPVNSPPYYPPYNGGIEKGQSELKEMLRGASFGSVEEFELSVRLAAHCLNHQKRRCLQGRIPCAVFFGPENVAGQFTKRKRKEVYDEIIRRSATISLIVEDACSVDTAWRIAVESWLLDHGFIAMSKTRKCYPVLSRIFAHN